MVVIVFFEKEKGEGKRKKKEMQKKCHDYHVGTHTNE